MDVLAFLTAPIAAALAKVEAKPDQLPTFKPRWWYRPHRLDARPVIWSLKNRPEEWEYDSHPPYWVQHIPSGHRFWIATFSGPAHLVSASGCGCLQRSNRGRLQLFQSYALKRAAHQMIRARETPPPVDHDHFAAHFVRADG